MMCQIKNYNLSTAIKTMFCSIVLKLTIIIIGRNVLTFITEESAYTKHFNTKVSESSYQKRWQLS